MGPLEASLGIHAELRVEGAEMGVKPLKALEGKGRREKTQGGREDGKGRSWRGCSGGGKAGFILPGYITVQVGLFFHPAGGLRWLDDF